MGDRERTESGQFVETVSLENVLGVFEEVRGPVITSSDVSDQLDCTTEAARQKLTRLYDRGEVDKRKSGRTVVYWRADAGDTPDAHTTASPTPADTRTRERGETVEESDAPDPVGGVLDGWEPDTEADAETARAQTRRAAAWLRERGGRHKRTDLVDALAGDSTLGERSWWERAVQPGLRRLSDAGLIEYRSGYHDYQWVGEDGDGTETAGVYDPTEEF